MHYRECISEYQRKLANQLTSDDKILWHYNSLTNYYKGVDHTKIEDPDLAYFIKVLTTETKYSQAALSLKNAFSRAVDVGISVPAPDNPLTKYPMGDTLRYLNDREHVIWYLNAYYNDVLIKESN